MPFDHHRLTVYHRALDAIDRIAVKLPGGRSSLRDQIDRGIGSVVANIAEGAGEFSPKEKARFYRMARRSAVEVAAWLEVVARRGDADEQAVGRVLKDLEEVVAMLVVLARRGE